MTRPHSIALVQAVTCLLAAEALVACKEKATEAAQADQAAPPESAPPSASPGAAPSVDPGEACALLTEAEASAALGVTVRAAPPERQVLDYATTCSWSDEKGTMLLQVLLTTSALLASDEVVERHGQTTVEKRYERLRSQLETGEAPKGYEMPENDGVDLPGIADAAVWAKSFKQLWLLKNGKALVTVDLMPFETLEDPLPVARELAAHIAARL